MAPSRNVESKSAISKGLFWRWDGDSPRQQVASLQCEACCNLIFPPSFNPRINMDFTCPASLTCPSCIMLRKAVDPFVQAAGDLEIHDVGIQLSKARNGRLTMEYFRKKPRDELREFDLIDISTDENRACPWPSITVEPRGVRNPDAAAQRITQWLETCKNGHERCQLDLAHQALPTRVIDVSGEGKLRLRVTDVYDEGRYACLSHCWGGLSVLCTTTSTYTSYQHHIPWDDLPTTFKHAIELTKRIGIRYLWIDSLCIIQDDLGDWRHEGSKMASIYANSYITFAAAASKNPTEGLYKPDGPERYFTYQSQRSDDQAPYTIYVQPQRDHLAFIAGVLPLMQRAWYFQERILSPRVVSFAESELYWECRVTQCCECGDQWPQRSFSEMPKPDISPYPDHIVSTQVNDWYKWQHLVKRYTRLNLTFQTDTLPALQGIATMYQQTVKSVYLAGLWEKNLLQSLLWRSELFGNRPNKYRAPTWSWPSIHGWIEWWPGLISVTDEVASILSASTIPAGLDPRGEIIGGSLVLQGRCIPATVGYRGINENFCPANCVRLTSGLHVGPGEWYPDISTNATTQTEILLMQMVELQSAIPKAMFFLGLKKLEDRDGTYERVGCARTENGGVIAAFRDHGEERVVTVA